MAKAWSAFHDLVLPSLPGAPLPLAEAKIREAAIEFIGGAQLWRAMLTQFSTVAGTGTYALSGMPAHSAVHELSACWCEDEELTPLALEDRDRAFPDWRRLRELPACFFRLDPDTISLLAVPNAAYQIDVEAALKPARDATDMADWIFERFAPDIACGALAMLMEIPAKPYSNPDQARVQRARFERALEDARAAQAGSFARSALRTRAVFGLR